MCGSVVYTKTDINLPITVNPVSICTGPLSGLTVVLGREQTPSVLLLSRLILIGCAVSQYESLSQI